MDIDNKQEEIINPPDIDAEVSSKIIDDFPMLESDKHEFLTSADQEILVDLNINILSRNPSDEAEMPQNKHIYNNNYWIPVPSGHDADQYLLSFIEHFELALKQSLTQTN